ncbi:DUF5817 domain-containing protein [Halorussus marinus]|uniref:DUF5817 domain-containing protein n=1 Tax=Halorussus marinus TaxID=2505976 RepID=UPI00106EB0F7|nr:DUF5817 domain-containing protein [Halorussus marinus]
MTYQIVGCSNCTGYWITENLREQATTECPLCFQQHDTAKLNVRFQHDNFETTAEIRSKIVAQHAGELDAYENCDDYGIQADRVDELHRDRERRFADEAEQAFSEYDELLADEVETSLEHWRAQHDYLEAEAWDALSDQHTRFADEAKEAFRDQDTRLGDRVDLDRDYSTVDHDDPETLGTTGGLSFTEQGRFADATLTLEAPVSELAATIVDQLRDTLVDAIRELADGRSALELQALLDDAGVTASQPDTDLLGLADRVARGSKHAALDFYGQLAQTAGRATTEDTTLAPQLLALVDTTPTIKVDLTSAFWDRRRSQREDICEYLAALARGCDVRIIGSPLDQHDLYDDHRSDLPVSRDDITPSRESRDDRVEAAKASLDRDGREIAILRALAGEDSQTLPYGALYSRFTGVQDSRIRQCISTLSGLGVVDTFGPNTDRYVELLPAGEDYLNWLDTETARQQTLEESVSDQLQSSDDSRVTTRTHEAPSPEGQRRRLPHLHTLQPLARWDATATAASTPQNGLAVVDFPLQEQADRGSPRWYYDYRRDRLVVGAEFDGPMQYWVCVARALASSKTFANILEDGDRLDDTDEFAHFLTENKYVLRDSRCLGHLPDSVEDGGDYVDELESAEEHLCELTKRLHNGDYDGSEAEYRGVITREALGLAGTMVHLLDLVDVEVVRQVRLPSSNGGRNDILTDDRRETLVKSLATGVAIQSTYNNSSVYRQLFETREEKRDAAIVPTVDYDDPFGSLIGSVCVVGDLGSEEDALVEDLRQRLGSPGEIHEDAPDIRVRVPVRSTEQLGRMAFATAVERLCSAKNIKPTREAVSVLRLFSATPFDAAAAVCGLSTEDRRRDIRLDEVRTGLAQVSEARVMPWLSSGVRDLVTVLLEAREPLSVAELCERADVATSTWHRNKDVLEALDIIRDTSAGVRLALPFRDSDEYDVQPWYTQSDGDRDDFREASVPGVVLDLLDELAPPREVIERVSEAVRDGDVERLRDEWSVLAGWLGVLQDVTADHRHTATQETEELVVFGRRPEQASLQEAAAQGGVGA